MPIENVKHGKHIVELKPGYSVFKQVGAPQVGAFGAKDLNGANFSLGWSFLTEPFLMVGDSHQHDFDQVIFFLGSDPNNVVDFDAEIEFTLEGELNSITYPACVYIPKGMMHGPLNIKRVTKPLIFIDITLSIGPSIRPIPPGVERR
jgi:hypothetical protein